MITRRIFDDIEGALAERIQTMADGMHECPPDVRLTIVELMIRKESNEWAMEYISGG